MSITNTTCFSKESFIYEVAMVEAEQEEQFSNLPPKDEVKGIYEIKKQSNLRNGKRWLEVRKQALICV